MPDYREVDQCPFCNAKWGDCLHVKLLADLDCETAVQADPMPPGSVSSVSNVNTPSNRSVSADGAALQAAALKATFGSR